MESVKKHYATYIQHGGDGKDVWKDRGRELGYDRDFLKDFHMDENGERVGSIFVERLFEAFCGSGCPLRLDGGPHTGDTVVDLGCGAGHDVILASRVVGPTGRVIGVDFTKEMLVAAQSNVDQYHNEVTDGKVEFIESRIDVAIESLPLEKEIANVVISNGVLNLCPDKVAAFQLAFELLRPGGRFLLSDLCQVAKNPGAVISCPLGDAWSR